MECHRSIPVPLPLFTMLVIRAAYQHGLSYPLTARSPARSSRRSLCRPCWKQGACTRLSRAQTTMNRSDSLVFIPICSASVSLLRIPRQTGRGGARASHSLPAVAAEREGGFRTYLLPHATLLDSDG